MKKYLVIAFFGCAPLAIVNGGQGSGNDGICQSTDDCTVVGSPVKAGGTGNKSTSGACGTAYDIVDGQVVSSPCGGSKLGSAIPE
jgi:hypothetical protein